MKTLCFQLQITVPGACVDFVSLKGLECRALQSLGEFPLSHPMPYIFMEWKELVISARRSFDDDASKVFFLNLRSSPGWKKYYVFVISNSKDKSQVSKPRWLHWPDESTRLLSKVIEEESIGSNWSSYVPDGRRSWLWCRSIAWKDPLLMCFGFTSPPGPVSPDIWNDSILCNFGNIRMKYYTTTTTFTSFAGQFGTRPRTGSWSVPSTLNCVSLVAISD